MKKRIFKKVLAMAAAILTIGSGTITQVPIMRVSAAYENTHSNTGNQREDIAAIAETQVGYQEGDNNYTKYNEALYKISGNYNYAWCQSFVSWCARQAGIPTSMIKATAGTVDAMDTYKAKGYWVGSGHVPSRGDIIYFRSSGSNSGYHVGIVVGCDGSTIYTVEGNSSDKVSRRSYAVGSGTIVGYGVPPYNDDPIIRKDPVPDGSYYPRCGAEYVSLVDALESVGADSSKTNRLKIAAANGISNYSYTANQNIYMLDLLKEGKLIKPSGDIIIDVPVPVTEEKKNYFANYFPACNSGYTSIVDALNAIGVDSSKPYRARIAAANGISDYSYSAEQNIRMLELLKSGKLINPDGATAPQPNTSGKYFPQCSSGFASIVDALNSVGVDSSKSNRARIASANGISNYSYSAEQNVYMLDLLKSGSLINPDWTEPPAIVNYTVSLDASGGDSPVSSLTVASNGSYNGLPAASREGYSFDGWFTSSSGGNKKSDGSSPDSASDHTLYAHWIPNSYNVTLSNNDGSAACDLKKVSFDSKYGDLGTPSRQGYEFEGWFTDIHGNTRITSDTVCKTADNHTLYAHWKARSYNISYNMNGGTEKLPSATVEYQDTYGTLPTPKREGYSFTGWYTSAQGGERISEETVADITEDQVLYAQWQVLTTTTTTIKKTTTTASTTGTVSNSIKVTDILAGDANCDGNVSMADAVLIMQTLSNPDKYTISKIGILNADIDGNGVTNMDALTIQKMLLGLI